MKTYRCDRCGAVYNPYPDSRRLLTQKYESNTLGRPIDLCDDCYNDFLSWYRITEFDRSFKQLKNDVEKIGHVDCEVCALYKNECPGDFISDYDCTKRIMNKAIKEIKEEKILSNKE